MNVFTQILVFSFSFLFGFCFYITSKLNKFLIHDKNSFIKLFITFIFVLNHVLIYLIVLYKINYGIFHFYFLVMLILGYLFSVYICKKRNKIVVLT